MTPSAKLYNWNVVTRALDIYGVKLEDDIKSLIIAGDLQIIVEMLQQVHNAELKLSSKTDTSGGKLTGESQTKVRASQQFQPTGVRGKGGKVQEKSSNPLLHYCIEKGSVDIASLDVNKDAEDIESCLEFLLVTLSKAFDLNPKQVRFNV